VGRGGLGGWGEGLKRSYCTALTEPIQQSNNNNININQIIIISTSKAVESLSGRGYAIPDESGNW